MNNIVIILPSLGKGGAQRATISLANYLSQNTNSSISIVALKEDDLEFKLNTDIKIIKLRCSSFRKSFSKLKDLILKEKPDLIYSALWHVNLLTLLVKFTLVFKGVKFIHIASVHNNPKKIIQTENKFLSTFYYYVAARFSNDIIAVSSGIQTHLINNCKIPKGKVHLAYNPAITQDHQDYLNIDLKNDFVEKHKGKYLFWVGRLDYQKNPLLFLETALSLKMPAIIIGSGPYENDVSTFIADNKLEEQILFLPFQENVMYFMKNAYLLLLTSKFEGFGLVLVEALYASTPVISTNCDYGPNEIIRSGENGFLVDDSKDAFIMEISNLLKSPQTYKNLTNNARPSSMKFVDSAVMSQYQRLFE